MTVCKTENILLYIFKLYLKSGIMNHTCKNDKCAECADLDLDLGYKLYICINRVNKKMGSGGQGVTLFFSSL